MDHDRLAAFYSGREPDDQGRTLESILSWTDDQLEAVHDYIQWVFPTTQPSAVNPFAPILAPATISAFAIQPELRKRLSRAFDRMLQFYGLRRADDNGARIEIDPDRFAARAAIWLRPGNHNHLRLTRIMQSLAELGLRDDALALQRCLLQDVANGPGANRTTRTTLAFWKAAVDGQRWNDASTRSASETPP